jgi:hypothetical protein
MVLFSSHPHQARVSCVGRSITMNYSSEIEREGFSGASLTIKTFGPRNCMDVRRRDFA